jgi:hypothetical protein
MLRTWGGLALGLLLLARLEADAPTPPPPVRAKGPVEVNVERLIEAAYRRFFKVYRIGAQVMTLRMPFGMNGEREGTPGYTQEFALGGKGTPEQLWPLIDAVLSSDPFRAYVTRLQEPREQAVIFDLERRSYTVSYDPRLLGLLEMGPYPGTETRVHVLRFGGTVSETDVYNYLYAVAGLGVDCAGFVYDVEKAVMLVYGVDADRELGRAWGVTSARTAQYVGLSFLDPRGRYTQVTSERIEDLRPGDVILFRGSDGMFKHSAVIQSIDLENGAIRYVQSTDWAPADERGVHESVIRFQDPQATLRDPTLKWLQQVRPPFRGEVEPRYWRNDGHRFFWYPKDQGSVVVRLRLLEAALLRADPMYYRNVYPPSTPAPAQAPAPGAPPSQGASAPSGGRLLPLLHGGGGAGVVDGLVHTGEQVAGLVRLR